MEIVVTTLIIGGMGFLCAILLALVARKFHVEGNPRVATVTDVLPQVNCGVCGYAGCTDYAKAVVEKKASSILCTPGGADVARKIGDIMGTTVVTGGRERKVAMVRCGGGLSSSKRRYVYNGITDCLAADAIHGGDKACTYGCIGYGSCARVCPVNAIEMHDGLAHIIKERCIACDACVKVCPRLLIELVPANHAIHVLCASRDKGTIVRSLCTHGCIGCKICLKADPSFMMDKSLATVDYTKPPVRNVEIIAKCPGKCIHKDETRRQELERLKHPNLTTEDTEVTEDVEGN